MIPAGVRHPLSMMNHAPKEKAVSTPESRAARAALRSMAALKHAYPRASCAKPSANSAAPWMTWGNKQVTHEEDDTRKGAARVFHEREASSSLRSGISPDIMPARR